MGRVADILIVGLGKTGLSVARFLARRGQGFAVADSRMEPPGLAALQAEGLAASWHPGPFDPALFSTFKTVIVSPGVAVNEPALQTAARAGAEIIGDIELFARHVQAPVIAITGSNGKSTVTTLVGELLAAAGKKVAVGGNLGTPALDLLEGEAADVYVLELSSFQLETTRSLKPAAAVVLNVSEDHMDRYPDLKAYADAKGVIYRDAHVAVFNRDDAWTEHLALCSTAGRRVSFGLDRPRDEGQWGLIEDGGETWLACNGARLLRESDLHIWGRHNTANALAALALVEAVGVSASSVIDALARFEGLPHRSQFVAHAAGMDWVNDSKGTNVGATLAALAGQTTPVVLIAGGLGKGQDFNPLRPVLASRARAVVLIGVDASRMAEAWQGAVPIIFADDMHDAVYKAARVGLPGDVVLLSPACASFDMFRGYEHRGEVFASCVRKLAEEGMEVAV